MNIYMICTHWTPFQAERDWKIHSKRFSKFRSNIYSILFGNTSLVFTDQPCTWRCPKLLQCLLTNPVHECLGIFKCEDFSLASKQYGNYFDHNTKLKSHYGKQNLKCNAMEPMVWQMVGNICGTISDVHRLITIQI